jgi:hypothetical protein
MQLKMIVAVVGLAAVALPLAVVASQPAVKRAPSLETAQVLSMLVLDPYENTELSVTLPEGFATLDVDADPFEG